MLRQFQTSRAIPMDVAPGIGARAEWCCQVDQTVERSPQLSLGSLWALWALRALRSSLLGASQFSSGALWFSLGALH
jgi:hypothetical protein